MILDLSQFGIKRPEKVQWSFEKTASTILESIPSKSLRKFLQKKDEVLAGNGIEYRYVTLTKDLFLEWLSLYNQKTDEYGYRKMISKDWYDEGLVLGKIMEGLFFYKENKLITGAIVIRYGVDRGMLGYSARIHIRLGRETGANLGSIIDYLFFEQMEKLGVKRILGGKSRNAFGVDNRPGYLEFKLRMGYRPAPASDISYLVDVPLDEDGKVLFFGEKDGEFSLFSAFPKDKEPLSGFENLHLGSIQAILLPY